MKRAELEKRLEEKRERLQELAKVKRTHWTRRPDEWKGKGKAAELRREMERLEGEILELDRWLKGNWVEA